MTAQVQLVDPTPTVIDAVGMSDADIQHVARSYGLESAFVVPASSGSNCDFMFRFWVPKREMDMCGHARERYPDGTGHHSR